MDLASLQALVLQGESETLEFKRSTGQRTEAMHTLCAFSRAWVGGETGHGRGAVWCLREG